MLVNGVGRQGEKINVADDFSFYVPYGWCYDIDEYALDGKSVLTVFYPASQPIEYEEGSFELEADASSKVILKFDCIGNVTVEEDATEINVDIDDVLARQSENAKNISLNASFGAGNDEGFRRMYKVVKNDPFLKVGYFTSGFLGMTLYNVLLFTSHHIYSALQIRFLEDDCENNEEILDHILTSLEPLNVKIYKQPEVQEEFSQPIYSEKIQVKVGSLNIMLPDRFEYVTEEHVPEKDNKAKVMLSDYVMVAAPADCNGGLKNFRDASLGINISAPQTVGFSEDMWKNIDVIKKRINSNAEGRKLNYVKEGINYLIGYDKAKECEGIDEPYWVSYLVVIFYESLQYTMNMYFNSKKADSSEYIKAVETFCSNIFIDGENSVESDSVSEEDYILDEFQRLEVKLDEAVIVDLKAEAKDAKVLFAKIATAVKSKNYEGLNDIDAVIEKVNEAIDEVRFSDSTYFNLSYMYRPFADSYEMVYSAQRIISDADFGGQIQMLLTEYTSESGASDSNAFPKRLSSRMDKFTELDIYKQFLESANYLIGEGNQIISKNSVTYIQKQLDEKGNNFVVQGTQYEGRSARIEKIGFGDKLTLIREPNNKYDSNAIELRNTSGSVGHLPSQIAGLLSPALDAGTISAVAEVSVVEPLSQRANKAKSPLLKVRIIVSHSDNIAVSESEAEPAEKVDPSSVKSIQTTQERESVEESYLVEEREKANKIQEEKMKIQLDTLYEKKGLLEEKRKDINKEIDELTIRKSKLGLFKGKEKKDIDSKIADLRNVLENLEDKISRVQNSLFLLQNQHGAEVIFGHNPFSKEKKITWKIVEKLESGVLLACTQSFEELDFWSAIEWINSEFKRNAFSSEEISFLVPLPDDGTKLSGKLVFFLSREEKNSYIKDNAFMSEMCVEIVERVKVEHKKELKERKHATLWRNPVDECIRHGQSPWLRDNGTIVGEWGSLHSCEEMDETGLIVCMYGYAFNKTGVRPSILLDVDKYIKMVLD